MYFLMEYSLLQAPFVIVILFITRKHSRPLFYWGSLTAELPLDTDCLDTDPWDREPPEGTWDQGQRPPFKEHGTRQPDRK